MRRTHATVLVLGILFVSACAPQSIEPEAAPTVTAPAPTAPAPTTTMAIADQPAPESPLANRIVPLGSAIYDPATANAEPLPRPVTVSIPDIGVSDAQIVDVGVLDTGEMEIPGRTEVGWYRYGPRPGEPGSAVLAAHIAFNGEPGVFRRLARVTPGFTVTVEYDDGSSTTFQVVETAQYPKDQLPAERVFARAGDPVLTLITCGGDFNRSLRSYSDNVVAYAVPVSVASG